MLEFIIDVKLDHKRIIDERLYKILGRYAYGFYKQYKFKDAMFEGLSNHKKIIKEMRGTGNDDTFSFYIKLVTKVNQIKSQNITLTNDDQFILQFYEELHECEFVDMCCYDYKTYYVYKTYDELINEWCWSNEYKESFYNQKHTIKDVIKNYYSCDSSYEKLQKLQKLQKLIDNIFITIDKNIKHVMDLPNLINEEFTKMLYKIGHNSPTDEENIKYKVTYPIERLWMNRSHHIRTKILESITDKTNDYDRIDDNIF